MKLVFHLRHFNDVDHISPVIWECLESGDDVTAVILNLNFDATSDPRLNHLRTHSRFDMQSIDQFLGVDRGSALFRLEGRNPEGWISDKIRRVLQKTGASTAWIQPILNDLDPDVCVFEWGPPDSPSHAEFFNAAEQLGIPKVALPHGLNIYLNEDIHPWRAKVFEQGKEPFASRSAFDAYVTQSEYDRRQEGRLGIEPDIHHVLGSARYYPEWQAINEDLYDAYRATGETDGKLRVVFMLPHWKYYVDEETTLNLISELADRDWIYLVVKEHTRGDSLPEDLDDRLVEQENTAVEAETDSVSLIKWSDVVINFGSSIGIEALLQEKHNVNPSYLHENTTIFDETGAGHMPESNPETLTLLEELLDGSLDPVPDENVRELNRTAIYGGREEHDVLEAHRDLLLSVGRSA